MLSQRARDLIAVFTMLATTPSAFAANTASFMPENDLWKQDFLEVAPNVNKDQFNAVIDAALKVYTPVAQEHDETIVVNRLWEDSTVNANVDRNRVQETVIINMYGGLARRLEIMPESFALVICHELGHAYGGAPYIIASRHLSAEGMADYYGAGECLKKILPLIPSSFDVSSTTGYSAEKCSQVYPNDASAYSVCVRSLEAGMSLGRLLSAITKETEPSYLTPDTLVVKETELSYPKTVQCRVDTYHSAVFQLAKPTCWFKPTTPIP
jgi:hypothetical protein